MADVGWPLASIAALFVSGCGTADVERVRFAPLAGMSCDQLADELADVDAFRLMVEVVDFDDSYARERQSAIRTVDQREQRVAAAAHDQGCNDG